MGTTAAISSRRVGKRWGKLVCEELALSEKWWVKSWATAETETTLPSNQLYLLHSTHSTATTQLLFGSKLLARLGKARWRMISLAPQLPHS